MHRQHYLCVLAALFKKRWLSRQRGTDHGEDGYGVFVSFRFACCQGTLVHSVHGGTTTYKLDPTVCSLFFFYTSIISIFSGFPYLRDGKIKIGEESNPSCHHFRFCQQLHSTFRRFTHTHTHTHRTHTLTYDNHKKLVRCGLHACCWPGWDTDRGSHCLAESARVGE